MGARTPAPDYYITAETIIKKKRERWTEKSLNAYIYWSYGITILHQAAAAHNTHTYYTQLFLLCPPRGRKRFFSIPPFFHPSRQEGEE
jgi:hypothetical protein